MAQTYMKMSPTDILVIKQSICQHVWGAAYAVVSNLNPSQVMFVGDPEVAKGQQE